jgi:hypothetical protein
MHNKFENLKEKGHFGNQGIDGRISEWYKT